MTTEELMQMYDLSDAFGTESRLRRTILESQCCKFSAEQQHYYRATMRRNKAFYLKLKDSRMSALEHSNFTL